MALYCAKAAGKNRFRVFDEEIQKTMGRRSDMVTALPKAIETGDVRLAVQPQVNLLTGEIRGFEALARWRWNDEELQPSEFIKVAEEAGLIQSLDMSILEQAAVFAVELSEQTGVPICIASNISALDFTVPNLTEVILDVLFQTQLPTERLVLEVTETVLMEEPEIILSTLNRLRDAGVKTALDDFGTGYSSLSYLMDFPFDTIKIDRSFVSKISDDPRNLILFSKVIELGDELKKTIIVEGIETPEQEETARRQGAHIGQGFFYSRPLEVDEATRLMLTEGHSMLAAQGAGHQESG